MLLNDPMLIGAIVYMVAMAVLFGVLFVLNHLAGRMHEQLTPPRRERLLAIEAREQPDQGAQDGWR